MDKALSGAAELRRREGEYLVSRLEGEELLSHWPAMMKELDRIPQYWADRWTKEFLLESSLRNEMQVWAVGPSTHFSFILITRVATYPAGCILQAVVAFGNDAMRSLPVLAATMQKFAAFQGCHRMEVDGRPGWERVLKKFDMKRTGVVLSAPVPNTRTH